MKKLTVKQELFVKEYLVDLNATQAALRAGYAPTRAKEQGYQNLKRKAIAEEIQKHMDARSDRTLVSADWVLSTIKDTTNELLTDKEKNAANIFKGCELLGKHLKLFTDKHEVSVKTTLEDLVAGDE